MFDQEKEQDAMSREQIDSSGNGHGGCLWGEVSSADYDIIQVGG